MAGGFFIFAREQFLNARAKKLDLAKPGAWSKRLKLRIPLMICFLLLATVQAGAQKAPVTMRVGYFANVTHSQALVGRATGRFEQILGPGARVEWKVFNAGPSAIEALFAGALDLAYIGPNPTIAGYVRSRGESLRVIAGATSGGAALVVRPAVGIQKPEDFHGKKVSTPQLGNTQDVALRAWLQAHNLKTREKGGDVLVIPIANPDQLTLFLKGEIDAAWAPEPWVSRLIQEANARLFLDERDLWPNRQFVTAHLIVRTAFLREHPDIVKNWLRAHVELTEWINAKPMEAKQIVNQQVKKDTGKALLPKVLDESFSRLQATCDPIRTSLLTSAQQAYDAGFLGRERPDLSGLYDLALLNEVLQEKKAKPIQ
jgi:NitT/TauT family transport system substrate-binding protein